MPMFRLVLSILLLLAAAAQAQESPALSVPSIVLKGVPFDATLKAPTDTLADGTPVTLSVGPATYDA
ncbi:MAG: hypothetical protein AAF637_19190, partial [Pseudomonadota bacterium]